MALGQVSILCKKDDGQSIVVGRIREHPARHVYQVLALLAGEYTLLLFSILFPPLSVVQRCCGKRYCPRLVVIKFMSGFEVLP